MAINDPSRDLAAVYNALHSDRGFPAADRVLTGVKADVWDECAAAIAWCLANGTDSELDALLYASENNPYRKEAKEKR